MKKTLKCALVAVAFCASVGLATLPAQAEGSRGEVFLAQSQAAVAGSAEQHLPGQWSALTPSKTTTVYIKLNGNPTKNVDGSLSFTGRMWAVGRVNDPGADLKTARLDANGKLSVAYPAGSGVLAYDGNGLVGNITYDGNPVNGLQFKKE